MVSCSSDPFQPMDENHSYTKRVIELLISEGFSVIVLTQNPQAILDQGLLTVFNESRVLVEVTVPSMSTGKNGRGIFRSRAPSAKSRFRAMEKISSAGIQTRLRLDPVVPVVDENAPVGQTSDDINRLVEHASASGASMVVSKTMVLTKELRRTVSDRLVEYYDLHSINREPLNQVLCADAQSELLARVYKACLANDVSYCNCVSEGEFEGAVSCRFPS